MKLFQWNIFIPSNLSSTKQYLSPIELNKISKQLSLLDPSHVSRPLINSNTSIAIGLHSLNTVTFENIIALSLQFSYARFL
jgi:hypothetical protein